MSNVIHTATPSQNVFFKPYTQRFHSFYDHKENKSKYYITPEYGQFTRIIGENTIIEGLEILGTSHTNTSVTIQISKGRLIINDTYIEVHTDNTFTYDQINMLDDSGFLVLTCSFINENTLRQNKLRYHLTYFDINHNSYGEFNHDKDQIILGIFNFSKNESNYINDFYMDNYLDVEHLLSYNNYFLAAESASETQLLYLHGYDKERVKMINLEGIIYKIRNDETTNINTIIEGGVIGITMQELIESGYLLGYDNEKLLVSMNPGQTEIFELE